jgi:hypothetical protein
MNVTNAIPALDQPAPRVIRLPRLRKRLLILDRGLPRLRPGKNTTSSGQEE